CPVLESPFDLLFQSLGGGAFRSEFGNIEPHPHLALRASRVVANWSVDIVPVFFPFPLCSLNKAVLSITSCVIEDVTFRRIKDVNRSTVPETRRQSAKSKADFERTRHSLEHAAGAGNPHPVARRPSVLSLTYSSSKQT